MRQLPDGRGARGLDGPADARLGRRDPRRGREAAAAGRARRDLPRARSNPHYPIGYWNRPEDTEEVFGGDWFHTKDAAQTDEDGYFWYAGRADDVIISAGYRIGPFEVESACVEHPAVKEAAAVASPDPKRGDIVKAFIVLAEGHEATDETADEIKTFVRGHSAYAYPREIEFVDDLPKTLTGKIRRIELREAERESKQAAAEARAPRGRQAPGCPRALAAVTTNGGRCEQRPPRRRGSARGGSTRPGGATAGAVSHLARGARS